MQTLSSLKKGDLITIVVSYVMTFARRVIFESLIIQGEKTFVVYKENARKRKTDSERLNDTLLIFAGHVPAPFVDSDTSTSMGNCCINMIGQPQQVRDFVAEQNLNPHFNQWGKITYRKAEDDAENAFLLYPDDAPADTAELRGLIARTADAEEDASGAA